MERGPQPEIIGIEIPAGVSELGVDVQRFQKIGIVCSGAGDALGFMMGDFIVGINEDFCSGQEFHDEEKRRELLQKLDVALASDVVLASTVVRIPGLQVVRDAVQQAAERLGRNALPI